MHSCHSTEQAVPFKDESIPDPYWPQEGALVGTPRTLGTPQAHCAPAGPCTHAHPWRRVGSGSLESMHVDPIKPVQVCPRRIAGTAVSGSQYGAVSAPFQSFGGKH